MSTSEKRETAVQKYFIKSPDEPKYSDTTFFVVVTIGGILSALIGMFNFRDAWGLFCIGAPAVFFAGSAWLTKSSENKTKRTNYDEAYAKAEPKPSDEQMDGWRNGDLVRIRKQSLSKLDLVPEQVMGDPNDPIMVVGPSEGARLAVGKDGILRFSGHDIVIVYLTDYHLAAYSCTVNMATGLETKESTQEYHYKDVVSVATQADNSRLFKVVVDGQDKPLADYQKFALSVASGERIEVVIAFPQFGDIIKNARLAPTGAENAVKVIRAMLREKKGGVHE
jgi:hypothetical protein